MTKWEWDNAHNPLRRLQVLGIMLIHCEDLSCVLHNPLAIGNSLDFSLFHYTQLWKSAFIDFCTPDLSRFSFCGKFHLLSGVFFLCALMFCCVCVRLSLMFLHAVSRTLPTCKIVVIITSSCVINNAMTDSYRLYEVHSLNSSNAFKCTLLLPHPLSKCHFFYLWCLLSFTIGWVFQGVEDMTWITLLKFWILSPHDGLLGRELDLSSTKAHICSLILHSQ